MIGCSIYDGFAIDGSLWSQVYGAIYIYIFECVFLHYNYQGTQVNICTYMYLHITQCTKTKKLN